MAYAGFWRRVLAYLIDIIPITAIVGLLFYFFLGFDATIRQYVNRGPRDHEARAAFLAQRNDIRNLSLLLYVVYATGLEASALRGTIGKRLVGIQVSDQNGARIGLGAAAVRNISKLLSFAICGLGCLWTAWSPKKRAWHDYFAGTIVFVRGKQANQLDCSPRKK